MSRWDFCRLQLAAGTDPRGVLLFSGLFAHGKGKLFGVLPSGLFFFLDKMFQRDLVVHVVIRQFYVKRQAAVNQSLMDKHVDCIGYGNSEVCEQLLGLFFYVRVNADI